MTDISARRLLGSCAGQRRVLGHPLGLATLSFTEMWERFSYYGMRALLILFMTGAAARGGLGLDARAAGAIYGLYSASVYLFSLPGGWVADRLCGQRHAVFAGGVLISLGNFLLVIPAGIELFYIGLLVIAIGTGLLKPNVSCMVGQLYDGDSPSRRDAGFSIFYFGINLGAFIGPLVAGTIGETGGYRFGFLASGVAMILGLLQYRLNRGWLGNCGALATSLSADSHSGAAQGTDPAQRRRAAYRLATGLIVLVSIVATTASGAIRIDALNLARCAGLGMVTLGGGFFSYLLLSDELSMLEKKRVAVIALFFLSSTLFWAGYEQAGSTLNLFARDHTDRSLFGAWFSAGHHPASWYQSVPALFVLLLAPCFALGWVALGSRDLDPSAPTKFGLALLQLAGGFIVMMLAARLVSRSGHDVLPTWLIVTYLLNTTGELCISPIGLSNVTRLAPPRYLGQMMGAWFLGMAMGNLAAGIIGGELADGTIAAMPHEFLLMAVVAASAGVLLLLSAKRVQSWMR